MVLNNDKEYQDVKKRSKMMMKIIFLMTILLSTVESRFIRASSEVGDTNFYDSHGRVRIFHGGNRVMKGFPWYFTDMLSSDDEFELLEKMGVNVVRLGYMWTGAMPSENYFNKTVRS